MRVLGGLAKCIKNGSFWREAPGGGRGIRLSEHFGVDAVGQALAVESGGQVVGGHRRHPNTLTADISCDIIPVSDITDGDAKDAYDEHPEIPTPDRVDRLHPAGVTQTATRLWGDARSGDVE